VFIRGTQRCRNDENALPQRTDIGFGRHRQLCWRICCCFSWCKMKKLALVLLLAVAVMYYFGYEPSDLIPSGPTSLPKVRHAPAAPEQTPGAAPQRTGGALVAAQAPDGSLANRWKAYPSATPVKR
jgi:hypothetical protein